MSKKWCSVESAAADVFVETVVAVESSRVTLQQIRGVEGSDYINASYIDVRQFSLTVYTVYCVFTLQHTLCCVTDVHGGPN